MQSDGGDAVNQTTPASPSAPIAKTSAGTATTSPSRRKPRLTRCPTMRRPPGYETSAAALAAPDPSRWQGPLPVSLTARTGTLQLRNSRDSLVRDLPLGRLGVRCEGEVDWLGASNGESQSASE